VRKVVKHTVDNGRKNTDIDDFVDEFLDKVQKKYKQED
jgi:hypothetical protein